MVSQMGCLCDACPNAVAGMFTDMTCVLSNFSMIHHCPSRNCFRTQPQCKAMFSQIGSTGNVVFKDTQAVSQMLQVCQPMFDSLTTAETLTPVSTSFTTTSPWFIASLTTTMATEGTRLTTSIAITTGVPTFLTASPATTEAPIGKIENFTTTGTLSGNHTNSSFGVLSSARRAPEQIAIVVTIGFASLNLAALI